MDVSRVGRNALRLGLFFFYFLAPPPLTAEDGERGESCNSCELEMLNEKQHTYITFTRSTWYQNISGLFTISDMIQILPNCRYSPTLRIVV